MMNGMYQFNALVNNENNLLNDLMGLVASSGGQVCHLNLAPAKGANLESLTMVVKGTSGSAEKVVQRMEVLDGVCGVTMAEQEKGWDRELVLLKVKARPDGYSHVVQLASVFGATVLSEGRNWVVLMAAGPSDRVDAFVHNLEPYGILEMGRTGQVTMVPFECSVKETDRTLDLRDLASQTGETVHLAEM